MSEILARQGVVQNQIADIVSALGVRSIVFVGMMGSGKSTVGRRLAARLRLPFVDADHEIETRHGGSLTASSEPGATTFSVWLPFRGALDVTADPPA